MPLSSLVARIIEIGGLVVSLTMASIFVPRAVRSWPIYAGAASRRSEDAGPEPVPPPPDVAAMLEQLGALGFERLGEHRVRLPWGLVAYDWLAVNEAGSTFASVTTAGKGALLMCNSAFAHHVWLQTYYPRGESIDSQDLLARTTVVSVKDAMATHLRGIEEMRPTHGEPRLIRNMADTLALDAEFREHHAARTLGRITWYLVRLAFLSTLLVAIFLVLLVLDW